MIRGMLRQVVRGQVIRAAANNDARGVLRKPYARHPTPRPAWVRIYHKRNHSGIIVTRCIHPETGGLKSYKNLILEAPFDAFALR
jgi:hypothetical protein